MRRRAADIIMGSAPPIPTEEPPNQMSTPVKVGIVGLGRWAKVLTRAASKSDKLQIVAGYSRSAEKRAAFQQELGVPAAQDMKALLSNPDIKGVILTVPNEQRSEERRVGKECR